jgi:hypothetical protein
MRGCEHSMSPPISPGSPAHRLKQAGGRAIRKRSSDVAFFSSRSSGLHRVFTCVAAYQLAGPQIGPFHRKLQRLRYLRRRSHCYRLERTRDQAEFAPGEDPRRFSRRTLTRLSQGMERRYGNPAAKIESDLNLRVPALPWTT